MLILWAVVADALDGKIARLTGTASEFGGELDSLADAISFGVAPALLVNAWAFEPIARYGWLAAFVFVVCGTMRLARFNVQRQVVDSRYFVGLPIPAAAGQMAALALFLPESVTLAGAALAVLGMMVTLSMLMVSTLRYPSFKKVDLHTRRSYLVVLAIALLIVSVKMHPEWVLLAMASVYTLSGPSLHLAGLLRRSPGPEERPA
jgi:CDP-diacylglycerol--serine O-phosphatidyltransferase